jgi:zinc transport system substrate-binding protein
MKRIIAILIVSLMILSITGCGKPELQSAPAPEVVEGSDVTAPAEEDAALEELEILPEPIPEEKLQVVATIFPEYDFARAIAGDLVDLTLLVPPGASVHSYEPSPADMTKVVQADLFMYVGGESDEWISEMIEANGAPDTRVLKLMDYVETYKEELKDGMTDEDGSFPGEETETAHEEEEHGEEDGHEEDEEHHDEEEESGGHSHEEGEVVLDEHIWVSPKNAIKLIDAIARELAGLDPANGESYLNNSKQYQEKIAELDKNITDTVNSSAIKTIVVADKFPFRYFVEDYGIEYAAAFPGCADQVDAAPQTIKHLIDTVNDNKLKYIYYIELSNQNVASAIAEETGAEMLLLNSCHNLSKEDFERGTTYVDLMEHNITALQTGLN